MTLCLPWENHPSASNVGVKQGATESPLLFAKLVEDILTSIDEQGKGDIVEGMECDGGAFMDDIPTWKNSMAALRDMVDKLLPALARYGLKVQPFKCQLLCLDGSRHDKLRLGTDV